MTPQHTPGPWRWEINEQSKRLHLVGGKPQFDLTIILPTRWGTGSATLLVRDTAHDGMSLMHKLHQRRDWISPLPGRKHHADWCAGVDHPDMRLIEAAPVMLEALRKAAVTLAGACVHFPGLKADAAYAEVASAIEVATMSASLREAGSR
jgi:hypothetical protein